MYSALFVLPLKSNVRITAATESDRNMRPIGHFAHLEKQFKSIYTYDYIIKLINRKKKNHYLVNENLLVLHLKKLESLSSKVACAKIV